MKKMTFIACAAMLTSAVVLSSCNKNEQNGVEQKAPDVTTEFAINLPSEVSGPRRMPGQTVQLNNATDFDNNNGMKGITIVPFSPTAAVSTASKRLGENIELGATNDANWSKYTNTKGRIALREGATVPSGTSRFLFYAESAASGSNKFSIGQLNHTFAGEPSAFAFWLQPILPNGNESVSSDAAYNGLLAYLNSVADRLDSVGGTAWEDYTALKHEGYYDLFQTYSSLTVLSSDGVQRMMSDLYKTLKLVAATDSLATNLKRAIANPSYAAGIDGDGNVTLVAGLRNFPQKLNIPAGSVGVQYSEGAFVGNAAAPYGSHVLPAQLSRYVYPASLWYYANSALKTWESSQKTNYSNGAEWATILGASGNKTSVSTKTRSIAIVDTIQYAVARLDVKVKIVGGTYLVDNNVITTGTVNQIENPVGGYPMSAVLISGQKYVGFDFTPETYASESETYTIYDTLMTNTIVANTTDYSLANSTLLLETEANVDQYIAVEFTNTAAEDFYGADGLVPQGGKFYLVGKLAAASATKTGNKVFKQDYTTTASLTITDLKKAYNNIPDLKTPELEIGLLVDLNWKTGTIYTIDFGND